VQGTSRPRIEGYEFVSKLGEGLLGATYKAKQLSLDRDVAIKVIRRELTANKDYTARFLEQAKQVGRLHHKNVAHVIDAGEINGIYYCISEYVRGQNLREILKKKKKLTERQALHIGLEAASALAEAQKYGLVHGDIKPSNIIVNIEGIVKVCDLGLASQINLETEFALPYGLYQSAYYISPEVVRAGKPDIRSDIYSLGATLFRLATGSYPFGKAATPREAMLAHLNSPLPDPREKNPEISQEVAQIIMCMLEPQPEDRYQTPKEMVSAFVNLAKKRKPASSSRQTPRRRHTRKRLK
jgi:serine/threonine-protein kinase